MRFRNCFKRQLILVEIMLALAVTAKAQDLDRADHVLIPQSRVFAYTAEQQGEIRVYEVDADISMVESTAVTTLTIRIENMTSVRQEAELLLPVPAGAVVSGFAYDGPGPMTSAKVLPIEEANRIYNQLVAQIRDPALVEFVGYNLIRTSIFPVEAWARQQVVITYEHICQVQDNRVDYILPRTESLQYQIPWTIKANIRSAQAISTVYSPSHMVYTYRVSDHEVSVMIESEAKFTPGPFQMSYVVQAEDISASVLAYPDGTNNGGYFLLLAGVPEVNAPPEDSNGIQRELTLVIDKSGSMSGNKIVQAKDAAMQVIEGLDLGEAFNVILYDSSLQIFSSEPLIKTAQTTLQAYDFIGAVNAGGTTNLYGALELALAQKPIADMLAIVLFLTDGLPTFGNTNEVDIRNLVTTANPFERRVFTFGVGYDVNAQLLDALAEQSRARATFVLPDESVEAKVAEVFGSLAGPVLSDPNLRILDEQGQEAVGRTLDVLPTLLKDLFAGDRLVVLGRYLGRDELIFELTGNYLGEQRSFQFGFDPNQADVRNGFVPRLWASRKIAEMITQIQILGADPSLTENDPRLTELATTIIALSTEFGIITDYTAFLAQEGTDLSNAEELLGQTADNLAAGARGRAGGYSVGQSINNAMQRSQDVLNRDSSYLNSSMERIRIVNTQQANDLTFFFKDSSWIDSRLSDIQDELVPDLTVVFGTDEFMDVALNLAQDNRQGALAFAQDIVMLVGEMIVLIDIPEDIEEPYAPEDPWELDSPGSGGTGGRGGR
jgi:Ca-activated chloride channel family protein